MSGSTSEEHHEDAQQGQWIDFNTLYNSSMHALASNSSDMQEKGLTILYSLASNADESMRSELGSKTLVPTLTKFLSGSIAPEGLTPERTAQIRLLSTAILWSLCTGHVDNKKRCSEAIPPVAAQLATVAQETEEQFASKRSLYKISAMFLWSVAYGITANKRKVLESGGVQQLAALLKHPGCDFQTIHAAAGAIWHLSELPETCELISKDESALGALVNAASSSIAAANLVIVPCLALSSIINHSASSAERVRIAGGFEALKKFTRSNNATKFESTFVWTTVKPLLDLLNSLYVEVVELGCFLSYSVCDKSDIPKLFSEGIVFLLKEIVQRARRDPNYSECAVLAKLTLNNLEISYEDYTSVNESHQPEQAGAGMEQARSADELPKWLKSLGLEELSIPFEKEHIKFSDLALLTDADVERFSAALPLGPKRRLQNAILSLKRAAGKLPALVPPQASTAGVCLICCDAPKDTLLVPCGHVATCEQCAQILRARKDQCPVCRTPVERIVKPFYV